MKQTYLRPNLPKKTKGTVQAERKVRITNGSVLLFRAPNTLTTTNSGVARIFEQLCREWKKNSQFMSSTTDMVLLPAYQQIIGLGMPAIPLILQELEEEVDQWFWALESITREYPVSPSDYGDVPAMATAWLTWGRKHGFIR